mgnify:CR=1 FL=1
MHPLEPTPLIGFAGGPFTLASYLIEGGPSKSHERTKAMMYGEPALWARLMDRLSDIAIAYLKVQVEAGARAIQLFDSWVGALPERDYREFVMPYSEKHKVEIRAEFFNALNRVNLGNPNTNLTNSLYGRITSAGDPRIVQLGLRYSF